MCTSFRGFSTCSSYLKIGCWSKKLDIYPFCSAKFTWAHGHEILNLHSVRYVGLIPLVSTAACSFAALTINGTAEVIEAELEESSMNDEQFQLLISRFMTISLQYCHGALSKGMGIEGTISSIRHIARIAHEDGFAEANAPFLPFLGFLCMRTSGHTRHMILGTICEAVKVVNRTSLEWHFENPNSIQLILLLHCETRCFKQNKQRLLNIWYCNKIDDRCLGLIVASSRQSMIPLGQIPGDKMHSSTLSSWSAPIASTAGNYTSEQQYWSEVGSSSDGFDIKNASKPISARRPGWFIIMEWKVWRNVHRRAWSPWARNPNFVQAMVEGWGDRWSVVLAQIAQCIL